MQESYDHAPRARFSWPVGVFTVASIVVYVLSVVCSIVAYRWSQPQIRFRTIIGIQATASAALVALTIFVAGAQSSKSVRLIEAGRVLLCLAVLGLQPRLRGVDIALILTLTASFALYQPARVAAVAGTIVTAIAISVIAVSGSELTGDRTPMDALVQLEYLSSVVVIALTTAALILYVENRELNIRRLTEIRRLRDTVTGLSQANLGYQRYASDAELRSTVEERNRITRELHDIIGYAFVNNTMMLEAALSKIHKDPELVQRLISMARGNLEDAQTRIRAALYLLRSTVPAESTVAYVNRLVETFRVATQVGVEVDHTNCPVHLPGRLEEFTVYFIQESLVNALKHGHATHVHVYFHHTSERFLISVTDDGVGFTQGPEGIGLRGMRERLEALHGELEIQDLGRGVSVIASIPFATPGAPAGSPVRETPA